MSWTHRILIFVLLLVPSAVLAWRYADMPRFGYLHDDAILFSSAKSLAATGEYRIPSLPPAPYQTKYPPLFPLYLSLVWKLNPSFPANLKLATFFSWLWVVPYLALCWILFRKTGFGEKTSVALVAIVAFNPYVVLFSIDEMTEISFTCLLLLVLLVGERESRSSAIAAGALAGVVYLWRTAGIALLIAMPAWYLFRRSRRNTLWFVLSMLPFILAWTLWTRTHRLVDTDLLGYTDYIGYQFLNVGLDNFALVWATNLKELLYGLGKLVLPRISDFSPLRMAAAPVAIGMSVGVIRLARKGVLRSYAIFGAISCGMLIAWHFPPNERFVLPLLPLLLAGLVTEMKRLTEVIIPSFANKEFGIRSASRLLACVIVILIAAASFVQIYGTFRFLPGLMNEAAQRTEEHRAVYAWMAEHLPASSTVLSYEDPVLYLYTGMRGNMLPLLPRDWYNNNASAVMSAFRDIAGYCRNRNIGYVFYSSDDFAIHGNGLGDGNEIDRMLHSNPDLLPLFQHGQSVLYQVRRVSRSALE